MKFFCTAIMALALFALTGCGGSKPTALPATQNPPTFSSDAANDLVKNLSQAASDLVASGSSAVVAGTPAMARLNEIFAKSQPLLGALKPDEIKKLQDWINLLTQQMNEAAVNAATPPAATQNAPAFSTSVANDFVKDVSRNANDFVAAAKTKDQAQMLAAATKFNETLGKAKLVGSTLKPDERKKFEDWANSLIQQVRVVAAAAATGPAAAAAPAAK